MKKAQPRNEEEKNRQINADIRKQQEQLKGRNTKKDSGLSLSERKKKRTQVGQSYTTVKAPISSDPGR